MPRGRAGASRRTVARGLLAALTLGVIALDLVTKYFAVSQLEGREPVRLLGGAVYLLLTRNSGAAFSLGTNVTFIFPIVAIVVVAVLLWMARRVVSLAWAVAFGLIVGGAVGNLIDRIFRAPGPFLGHVVDFISVFNARGDGFPVFNVADSALCVGVGLAVLLELTGRRREGGRVGAEGEGAQGDGDGEGAQGDGDGDGARGDGAARAGGAERPVGDVTDSARAGD